MLALLIGAGLVLTVATGAVQFRRFTFAIREVLGKLFAKTAGKGTVTPFQALATSLASTVGVGNIAGVSTAISLGGPGALFWMFFSGVVGMATKFSEIAVALHYREPDSEGTLRGGRDVHPFKRDEDAVAGNDLCVADRVRRPWNRQHGAGELGSGCGRGQFRRASDGDGRRLGRRDRPGRAGRTSPHCRGIAGLGAADVHPLFAGMPCDSVFARGPHGGLFAARRQFGFSRSGRDRRFCRSWSGGVRFVTVLPAECFPTKRVSAALRSSIARPLPIIPARQACYGIFGVFTDTLVICMLTGLVVLTTGVWETGETGAELAADAFAAGLPGDWGHYVVSVAVILFAFSTVIGWAYYGETGAAYLFGTRAQLPYRLLWIAFVFIGATGSLRIIWDVSDTLNGLMALPNLVAVLGSLGLLRRLVREFFAGNPG